LAALLAAAAAREARADGLGAFQTSSSNENGRRLRILLVEDNAVNQKLAVRLVEKQGHSVEVAGNGIEALAKLGGQDFDLILMDVQMPEMDGFETTAAIRSHERTSGAHLPIIAMTAHALKGDRERCLEAGMDSYISKPMSSQELKVQIETWARVAEERRA